MKVSRVYESRRGLSCGPQNTICLKLESILKFPTWLGLTTVE